MIAEKEIAKLAEHLGINRDEAFKKALEDGIKELRVKKAIELYASFTSTILFPVNKTNMD